MKVPPGRSVAGLIATTIGALEFVVAFTVTTVCAENPSTDARIVAVPTATPVTSPCALTVAMSGAVDCQKIVGFLMIPPFRSFTVGISCTAPFGMNTVAVSRESEMPLADGFVTTIVASPVAEPDVARTTAPPAWSPVMVPVDVTLTMAGASDVHVGIRSVMADPLASTSSALAWAVAPTKICGAESVTVMDFTGETSDGPSGPLHAATTHASTQSLFTPDAAREREHNTARAGAAIGITAAFSPRG